MTTRVGDGCPPRDECTRGFVSNSTAATAPRRRQRRSWWWLATGRGDQLSRRHLSVHDDLDTVLGTPHGRRRITPEEGEDGHPLFQADGDLILDGEVQQQVHPERPGGERLARGGSPGGKHWT